MGLEFSHLLNRENIKSVQTTPQSPQSNGVCEQMHQVIANTLRIIMQTTHINNIDDATQIMDNAIATCVHAHCCAVSKSLKTSLGALVFGRDMLVDVPVIADLIAIRNNCQQLIDQNAMRHNRRRYDYHYRVDEWVMKVTKDWDKHKLIERLHGPYRTLETQTNGTVPLGMAPNVIQTVNIQKLRPYKGPTLETNLPFPVQ